MPITHEECDFEEISESSKESSLNSESQNLLPGEGKLKKAMSNSSYGAFSFRKIQKM